MVARPLKLESLGKPATEETASKQRSKRVADVADDFKLTALGQNIKGLSTSELIAILLSSSQVSVGQSVLQKLSQTGQEPLEVLRDVSDKELMKVFGVGPAKAKIILAAVELGKRIFSPRLPEGAIIDSSAKAASAFSYELMCQAQERFATFKYSAIRPHNFGKWRISESASDNRIVVRISSRGLKRAVLFIIVN